MRLVFFLIVFLYGIAGNGQADSLYNHETLITFSPSAFLNLFPGVQFGVEKIIDTDKTVEFEIARLFKISQESSTPGIESPRLETKNGIRLKLGYKKFISRQGIFLATLYLRRTTHNFEEWVFREGGRFEQLISYKSTKRLLGPTLGLGMTNKLSDSFYMETAINLGLGSYLVRQTGIPSDVSLTGRFFEAYHDTGEYAYPIFGLSLKIKYGLKRKTL